MKIVNDSQSATLTLVPMEEEEQRIVASLAAALKPEDKLRYGGRLDDGESKFCSVKLCVGEHEGNDGLKLILTGTTEADKFEVNGIRNTCYFGSNGLIFLGVTEVDGKQSLVTTAKRCQHCGANMTNYARCEWKTCDACAAKCEHSYTRGMIHGGGTDLGIGEYCEKCGCGKPMADGERNKTVVEHHLAVEKELGVHVLYHNGPPYTPREAVEFNRFSRRYRRSKSRRRHAPV